MLNMYMLTSVFLIVIIATLLMKVNKLLPGDDQKSSIINFFVTVGVYIILDAVFVACFLTPGAGAGIFRVVALLFFLVYVILPYLWYQFSKSFVKDEEHRWVQRILNIPLIVLVLMVIVSVPTGCLWTVSDDAVYERGYLFRVFSALNLFYYILPAISIIMLTFKKNKHYNPYLLQSFFFSLIPLLGIVINLYFLPFGEVYPFQPFCLVAGTLYAYLFLVEQQKSALDKEHSNALSQALRLESEALKKAQAASQAKALFLSNMSHDIRTPLNAIIGFSDIIAEDPSDEVMVKNSVVKIKRSGEILLKLISDIPDLSRIESGRARLDISPRNINTAVENLRNMFDESMKRAGIEFSVVTDIKEPNILCDDMKITQIMKNLLDNGRKFTPRGGKVVLSVGQEAADEDGYAVHVISVKDTGIGMSEEFRRRAFEEFERERTSTESGANGTGLGLAIVKKLVDLMGGDISINSKLGCGTEVIIRLKFRLGETGGIGEENDPLRESADFTGKRILLTEDNELNREIACELLRRMGFSVDEAEDGVVAVDKLIHSGAGYYDIILMDSQMPVMDGYRATAEIRRLEDKRLADIPIIAMTANTFEEDKQKCFEAGIDGHISKPVDPKIIRSTIYDVLRYKNLI